MANGVRFLEQSCKRPYFSCTKRERDNRESELLAARNSQTIENYETTSERKFVWLLDLNLFKLALHLQIHWYEE